MNLSYCSSTGEYLTWPNPSRNPDPNSRQAIPAKIKKKIFERDHYRCRYCGSFQDLIIEHVIPFVRTKDNSEENLVTACHKCNSKKQDRTPEEAGLILMPPPVLVSQSEQ
jgi:5-methylcytosine-specific restriction endonuclease McrA